MSLPAYAMNLTSFPEMYEQRLVWPLFRPFAELTLDRLDIGAGQRLLDVACGTGIVARLAKQRLGPRATMVGVDVSGPMLAVAANVAPDIDWREGSAEALPVGASEQFDVVVCQQGLQFFPAKEAAARELRRVLAENGKAAIAVWRTTKDMPVLRDLQLVAERHLGHIDDQRYGFGDADALERLIRRAGFRNVSMDVLTRKLRFAVGGEFIHLNAIAFVGMSSRAKTMSDEERARVLERVVDESFAVVPKSAVDGPLEFAMSTNLAIAHG